MRRSTARLLILLGVVVVAFPFAYPLSRAFFRGALRPGGFSSRRNPSPVVQQLATPRAPLMPDWELAVVPHRFLDTQNDAGQWWLHSREWTRRIRESGVDSVIADLHQASPSAPRDALLQALDQSSHILRADADQAWFQVYCRTRVSRSDEIDRMLGRPPESVSYLPRFVSLDQIEDPLIRTLHARTGNLDIEITPDGNTIITDGGNYFLFWELASGQQTKKLAGRVEQIALSPDGKYLAGGRNFPLRGCAVWDLESSEQVTLADEPMSCGFDVAFSPDSRELIALGSTNGVYRTFGVLYDLKSGAGMLLSELEPWRVTKVLPLENMDRVLFGTTGGCVLYNARTAEVDRVIEYPDETFSVAYSPLANLVATTAIGDAKVRLWDGDTFDSKQTFDSQQYGVGAATFSPVGQELASIDVRGNVCIWNFETGEMRRVGQHGSLGRCVKFTPDGKLLLSASDDHRIKVWDAFASDSPLGKGWSRQAVRVVRLSPDGRLLATGGSDGIVRIWDAKTGRSVRAFKRATRVKQPIVLDLAFSPDSSKLCVVGYGKTIEVWDLARFALQRLIRVPKAGVLDRFGDPHILKAMFSADGETVFTAEGGLTRRYLVKTGKLLTEFAIDQSGKSIQTSSSNISIAVAEDGSLLGSAHTREIRLWDVDSGELKRKIAAAGRGPRDLKIFADASLVAADVEGEINVWSAESGERIQKFAAGKVMDLMGDGRRVVTGSDDGFLRIWDIESGAEMNAISIGESILSVSVSADGTLIVMDGTGTVHVLDPVAPETHSGQSPKEQ